MRTRKLGTLTIGQAPRPDITPILDAFVEAAVPRLHLGVLDGLTHDEVRRDFTPAPGAPVLVTRMRDGSPVVIDKVRTQAAARDKLAALEEAGCSTILMLCTGQFENLACRHARLVEPDRILPPAVAALAGDAQVGIVVPLAEQAGTESGKWRDLRRAPLYGALSPYGGDPLGATVRALEREGAEILVLDCMGFTEAHRREAANACGLPVVLSNAMIAKIISEII